MGICGVGDPGEEWHWETLFLKAGAELSEPLFVFGHFCTPHIVCPCYMLRGIQLEEIGNSISPQRISNHWRNPHLKENCQQLNSFLQWAQRKWAMAWSGNEIMLIICTVSKNLDLGKITQNLITLGLNLLSWSEDWNVSAFHDCFSSNSKRMWAYSFLQYPECFFSYVTAFSYIYGSSPWWTSFVIFTWKTTP